MIDWNRVDELVSEIGVEDFGEVVEIFLEEVDAAMGALGIDADVEGTQQTLHLVKGCAWNLGFAELGRICAEQEAARTALSADTHARLHHTYDASRSAFLSGLAERAIETSAA